MDAPVDIVITGPNGEIKLPLKTAITKNKDLFERNQLDIFQITDKDIGQVHFGLEFIVVNTKYKLDVFICCFFFLKITQINIGHNGDTERWYLESVKITKGDADIFT